ncbi:protoporphyrinogen oxidase [Leifsonia sp. H3M29-4]|uniref:protoporphyrinogen oxidase n=1 Tax=Salinibacterium metalliresistens TaxID=3031321 RepID=UPI0023D9AC99|nr:protoporphyrinogen oxidase [Salinibacterium metalliresistens]MDF1480090.1 protoporphyrinogen oxidase [Salinibacterium metalliresistens]
MNPRIFMLGLGLAVGYVLGTRDGRERYDQMKAWVTGIWEDPRVAKARHDVEVYARQQAPIIRERAEAAAKAAPGVAKDAATKVAATAKDVAHTVGDTAKDLADRAGDTAKDIADRAGKLAGDLRERGEAAVDNAVATAGKARERVLDVIDDEDDAPKA